MRPGELEADERTAAVEALVARVAATVDGAIAIQQHLAEEIDGLRTDVADVRRAIGAVARALANRPSATTGDVFELHRHLDELRDEVRAARPARPRPAGPVDPAELDDLWATLDAVARLVQQAVRSLHTLEAATVGLPPSAERERTAAEADLSALRAARTADGEDSRGLAGSPERPST